MSDVIVRSQDTPNPNSRRYLVDRAVQEHPKGRFFKRADASDDPLVQLLFQVEGVSTLMLLPDSVTVSKDPTFSWDPIDEQIQRGIQGYFS